MTSLYCTHLKGEKRQTEKMSQQDLTQKLIAVLFDQHKRSKRLVSSGGKKTYQKVRQRYPKVTSWLETKWAPRYVIKEIDQMVKIFHYDLFLTGRTKDLRYAWIKIGIQQSLDDVLGHVVGDIQQVINDTDLQLTAILQREQ